MIPVPNVIPDQKFSAFLEAAPDAIVVVNHEACIVMVNGLTEKIFGYTREELLGQKVEMLVPEQVKTTHVKLRDGYIANPHTRPMGAGRLLSGRKKDGSELPVEISLSPLETEQGTLIMSIVRDVTDRRRAEEEMKATLKEKEALLKEIHHRVKNNLQVTSSLLHLQSEYIQDEHVRELFAESQNRIRSMALVHEKLYRSSNLSQINFFEYAESLAQLLLRSFGVNQNLISIKVVGGAVALSIENAVPCGLILNELISNCLKHAFPHNRVGEITIGIEELDEIVTIGVADNGVGFPKEFNFEKSDSLGLKLVHTLVKQLNGSIEINTVAGSEIKFHFGEKKMGGKL